MDERVFAPASEKIRQPLNLHGIGGSLREFRLGFYKGVVRSVVVEPASEGGDEGAAGEKSETGRQWDVGACHFPDFGRSSLRGRRGDGLYYGLGRAPTIHTPTRPSRDLAGRDGRRMRPHFVG
jgi:hypothetical protein